MHQVFQVVLDFQANHEVPEMRCQNINRLSLHHGDPKKQHFKQEDEYQNTTYCVALISWVTICSWNTLFTLTVRKTEEDLVIHLKNLMCSAP